MRSNTTVLSRDFTKAGNRAAVFSTAPGGPGAQRRRLFDSVFEHNLNCIAFFFPTARRMSTLPETCACYRSEPYQFFPNQARSQTTSIRPSRGFSAIWPKTICSACRSSRSQLPLFAQLPLLWMRPFRYLPKSISGTQHRAMAPTSTVSPITFQPWAPKGKMPRPYNKVANAINRKKGPVR